MPSFGESPQGPFNAFFPKGENSAFGVHELRFIGSGLPGIKMVPATGSPTGVGSGGVPGVSCTYLGQTGLYDIRFPPTKTVNVSGVANSSSGYYFDVRVQNLNGPSGSCQLQVVRNHPSFSTTGVTYPSGQGYIPTGTNIALTFFAAPNSDGITAF